MKIDIVLLSYGEPVHAAFLEQWRYSNRILNKLTRLVAPIPKLLIPLIGAWRGRVRVENYKANGYSSPLESITEQQANLLRKALSKSETDHNWNVHAAYEFRDPSLSHVLDGIRNDFCDKLSDSCDQLLMIPMYAAQSDFTTGISQRDFHQYHIVNKHSFPDSRFLIFRNYLDQLADLMIRFIRRKITEYGISSEECGECGLLLGCHGTVINPPDGITDTGYSDTKQLYDLLENALQAEFKTVSIGWMNHRKGGEWTTPTFQSAADYIRNQGIKRLIYFPFGFLADNAETQLESKKILHDIGIDDYIHLPCLNDDAEFIDFLAQRVINQIASLSK
jgi:protoporphyrin/coproporphyrin ferrochelatase